MNADVIIPASADEAEDATFRTVEAALRFAFGNRHRGSPDTLAKLVRIAPAAVPRFSDSVERAAWAGDIRRRIQGLSPVQRALLTARFAPRAFPCACRRPCCSGWQHNAEWLEAAGELTRSSVEALSGVISNRRLRDGIVRRWAGGERVNIGVLADKCGVHRNTAGKHARQVTDWLNQRFAGAVEAAYAALRD